MFITITISKQEGKRFGYTSTGWRMYAPVRGTGVKADKILSEIKRRTGVAPFRWTKR